MGLGVKILLTGVLFMALSSAIIGFLGSNRDIEISYRVKVVMVLTWYGGLAAMIVGALMSIWM